MATTGVTELCRSGLREERVNGADGAIHTAVLKVFTQYLLEAVVFGV